MNRCTLRLVARPHDSNPPSRAIREEHQPWLSQQVAGVVERGGHRIDFRLVVINRVFLARTTTPFEARREQESSIVFKKLSKPEEEEDEQDEFVEPPASALHRRQALVPPKMLTDGYESSSEDISTQGSVSNDQNTQKTRRRSSIVVIPPMQICPGDLLVYSKVLTHRNNLLADIDGSTQCLAVSEDSTRKAKNTWSLLRLFDRANRAKTECLGGLEEVLSTLRPSEFCDEQLAKYKASGGHSSFLSVSADL
ncbi:hypothetical protein HPB50_008639 [Hyalomma asiaticum]|uniref:Uncharacterized protein n=1 Tax=Hyalomma asiaticum TaxID=266040 RepID=A0ACB7RZ85_HYAAI|nr:hypothetical protein HPB50_008639 [Hyalomma asiaticum]